MFKSRINTCTEHHDAQSHHRIKADGAMCQLVSAIGSMTKKKSRLIAVFVPMKKLNTFVSLFYLESR